MSVQVTEEQTLSDILTDALTKQKNQNSGNKPENRSIEILKLVEQLVVLSHMSISERSFRYVATELVTKFSNQIPPENHIDRKLLPEWLQHALTYGEKIEAIKGIRRIAGFNEDRNSLGLKQAKAIIDSISGPF
jgi:ribosomal protein L7/L12